MKGVRTMIELAAAAKGVEEDALQQIDHSEAQVLKHLLRRVIRNTARDVPALWPVNPPQSPAAPGGALATE